MGKVNNELKPGDVCYTDRGNIVIIKDTEYLNNAIIVLYMSGVDRGYQGTKKRCHLRRSSVLGVLYES